MAKTDGERAARRRESVKFGREDSGSHQQIAKLEPVVQKRSNGLHNQLLKALGTSSQRLDLPPSRPAIGSRKIVTIGRLVVVAGTRVHAATVAVEENRGQQVRRQR